MAFVDKQDGIGRNVIKQARRWLAGPAPRQVARIIFNAGAVADFIDHFYVKQGSLFEALGFQQLVCLAQFLDPNFQFVFYAVNGRHQNLARGDVVRLGIHREPRHTTQHFTGQWIEKTQILNFIIEQFNAHRLALRFSRMDIDNFASNPVVTASELHVIARVLQFGQAAQQLTLINDVTALEVQHHLVVSLRITQTIDRRHRGNDNHIAPLKQRLGRGQPHLLYVVIDRRILFDKRIRCHHIRFRLVVVVVRNKVLHRIVREELFHLPV